MTFKKGFTTLLCHVLPVPSEFPNLTTLDNPNVYLAAKYFESLLYLCLFLQACHAINSLFRNCVRVEANTSVILIKRNIFKMIY